MIQGTIINIKDSFLLSGSLIRLSASRGAQTLTPRNILNEVKGMKLQLCYNFCSLSTLRSEGLKIVEQAGILARVSQMDTLDST